ncbi:cysteine--tRNA ligase [Candidatus Vallotia tarda]|uniref:Cysteine--tRNA ligase n=1 Tax=Candidatus Vallotiella hemipterorum TaxID=1177213 RepID=A0A916JVW2_9BURK|nr:cysteine--tRNA ligase [Candidatus Vallotia tarda]CAG7601782.1 Cysteine--tRNA ligase [Candidatus Vallotia tarda]
MDRLRLYNTFSCNKEIFVPLREGEIRMYVCGMTVYDYCHVGHGRLMVVFDMIQRWLRALGYRVIYVRNITDIDDKIIRRAMDNGESIHTLTDRFIQAMYRDETALNIKRPDYEPRATQFIPQILSMIDALKRNGYAYQGRDGDINYSVRKFATYGQLSGRSLEHLRGGKRIVQNNLKKDPLDFVLWKRSKENQQLDISWDSKWGWGRPGWHIECSAMSCALLGERLDIHGGGQDLQFPHHENEIAQSEGASGQHFVNYWLHNGFVNVDNEKMSKSLGNFFTLRDALRLYDGEVIRTLILRTHYRSPLNYSVSCLDDARTALTRLYTALKDVTSDDLELDWSERHAAAFRDAMNDDFNTPAAFATLFDLVSDLNRTCDPALGRQLKRLGSILGVLEHHPSDYLQGRSPASDKLLPLDVVQIDERIKVRLRAKSKKNYIEADRIRAALLDHGILLEDKPGGTTEWRRV